MRAAEEGAQRRRHTEASTTGGQGLEMGKAVRMVQKRILKRIWEKMDNEDPMCALLGSPKWSTKVIIQVRVKGLIHKDVIK